MTRRLRVAAATMICCLAGIGSMAMLAATSAVPPTVDLPTPPGRAGPETSASSAILRAELTSLERRRDARLGLVAIDTATGDQIDYRADERFAMASTVKVLLAAVVLDQVSPRELEERLSWTSADLVPHSPVTERHIADGMTVRRLIHAALTTSDNTATNLLFHHVGGPGAVERRLVELGDTVTSVERVEPDLNDWRPDELRDTSTPRALARAVHDLTLGPLLPLPDRRLLNGDLHDSTTGTRLVRAGVPASWAVADKSGTAAYGTRNNVAVVQPPGRAPWVVVVMTSHADADAVADDALVARAARIVVDHWS